jgi:hypothetical protein
LIAELRAAREGAGYSMRELSGRLGRAHNFCTLVEGGTRSLSVIEFLEWCIETDVDAAEIIRRLT